MAAQVQGASTGIGLRASANIWWAHEHEDTCEKCKPMHLFDSEHKEEDQNLAPCGNVAGELWQD